MNTDTFKKMSGNAKLDFVLSGLDNYSKSVNEIQKDLGLELNTFTLYEVRGIINKLIKDGNVEVITDTVGSGAISYKLSFEGKELVKKRGYKRKYLKTISNGWLIKDIIKLLVAAIVGFLIAKLTAPKSNQQEQQQNMQSSSKAKLAPK